MKWVILTLILVAIGMWYGKVDNEKRKAGYFETWELQPKPEATSFRLIAVGWHVFMQTPDGTQWACQRREGCIQEAPIQIVLDETIRPCDFTMVAFSEAVVPPEDITDCIYTQFYTADSFETQIAVLDSKNNLWLWEHSIGGFGYEYGLFFNVCLNGFWGGFLVVITWLLNKGLGHGKRLYSRHRANSTRQSQP